MHLSEIYLSCFHRLFWMILFSGLANYAIVSFQSIWQGPAESAKKISKSTAMASILAKTKVYQSNGWSCQKGRNGRWLVSFILWQKSSLFTTSNPCFSSLHIIDEASNSTRVINLQESNLNSILGITLSSSFFVR